MPEWLYAALLRNRDLRPTARMRAGIFRRGFAALIDLFIAMIIPTFAVIAARAPQSLAVVMIGAGAAIIWPLMNIITTWRRSATPGKRLLGMRVRTWDPKTQSEPPLQMGQILLREGIYKAAIPLSFVAWGQGWLSSVIWVGYLLSLRLRIDRRTLHDLMTHTQVVRTRLSRRERHELASTKAGAEVASAPLVEAMPTPLALEAAEEREPSAPKAQHNRRSSKSRKRGSRRR